jgi:tRNA (cytidine32/uridine32-2'-O)-methyltransferase
MSFSDNITILLVGTTHPGNIGAAARAMKTMGLFQLSLVTPKYFPNAEATARASGADDVLTNAQVFETYEESLTGCQLIFGCSVRQRSLPLPVLTPRACAEKAVLSKAKVAIVFGREHSGLTNAEMDLCHYLVTIPTNPDFYSLNVASAVQVLAYELRCASELENETPQENIEKSPLAQRELLELFYQHLEEILIEIKFLNPREPKRLMQRLRRLFNRSQLTTIELGILRGIFATVQKYKNRP